MAALGITGSTGRLGGRIARLLAAADVEQRLLCRSPAKAPTLPRTEVVPATYADR
ncbi:MAG: SDR family NAD(P)-dependent oxidoreductase, partial [Nocardioidaceae bacterium]|nr:SDR family NAD(P)-dependent oxidoreductase [Nocardioidaceae bacterium]